MSDTFRISDKGHTVYKNAAGKRVPGATTITGVLNKPHLVKWANNLGLQGIDSSKYVDSLANAGTLAHYMAECFIAGVPVDQKYLDEFSKIDQDRAATSVLKVMEWKDKHPTFKPVLIEAGLVSERHQFGGTIDIYGELDGQRVLIDIKTCKGLYGAGDDRWTQCAGYEIALVENGNPVDDVFILRVGRDEAEGFEFARCPDRARHIERFILCRQLYALDGELRKSSLQ